MLKKHELDKIKDFLETSQNPLFFFDNDVDGLCSFLLLRKALGRGKGVAIKSFPDLNKGYSRKIEELNPDAVFILDKPRVDAEFINNIYDKGIPIIWIDHHEVQVEEELVEKTNYFNSFPSSEPVTYICYNIFKRKEDMWVAMIGCIGDVYMPEFAGEFAKNNPEVFDADLSAFDSLYMTEIGKIIKILNFGLKDSTTNVLAMIKFLIKSTNAYDLLEENKDTKPLYLRYKHLNKIYEKLIAKAEKNVSDSNLLFFSYSGEMSMSSEISNELYFKHKKKLIAVAFRKQDKANISIRGERARELMLKAIKNIESATGGGHEQACGTQVPIDKLDEFRDNLEKELKED